MGEKDINSIQRTVLSKIPGNSKFKQQSNREKFLKIAILAGLVGFIWFFRPLFHSLIYATAYSPGFIIGLVPPLVIGVVLFLAPPLDNIWTESVMKKGMLLATVFMFFVVIGGIYGIGAMMIAEKTVAENTMDSVEYVDTPPAMNGDNPRIVPRAVSDTRTDGTLSYSQHRLGTSDIARADDGGLVWSYGIEPDQFRNRLSGNQIGLVHSDMTAMESQSTDTYDNYEFVYGGNMVLWNNVDWQVKKNGGFWSAYSDDPYEFVHDGDAYIAFPKTGHEWNLAPIPHTTPTWDGLALVHEDGKVEHLSPEEAQERPELDGQRLYPLANTKRYAESLNYRNGIINQMGTVGTFEGVIEPAEMPSGVGNDQPFVVDMEGEVMNYMYAMGPPGSGSGLSEIWFFNAENGQMQAYDTGSSNVFGPNRAVGIAEGTDTQTSWGPDGQAMAVEPVLVTAHDNLYWHIKVVTSDQSDVVRNIFINAESSRDRPQQDEAENAVVMDTSQEVRDFIEGDVDEDDLTTGDEVNIEEPTEEEQESGIAYYIVIKDEFGEEVDRIPVEEGQETVIESGN